MDPKGVAILINPEFMKNIENASLSGPSLSGRCFEKGVEGGRHYKSYRYYCDHCSGYIGTVKWYSAEKDGPSDYWELVDGEMPEPGDGGEYHARCASWDDF